MNDRWNAATYLWNDEQTDASLITAGADVAVNWLDENGLANVVAYHVPGVIECGMCHRAEKNLTPIGLKIRNMNFDIVRSGAAVNQLQHLQKQGIVAPFNSSEFTRLPDWDDGSFTVAERARAYLDVNCAHCHNPNGFASKSSLNLTYEIDLENSKIARKKDAIELLMSRGAMPLIGTTVVDEKGLRVIRDYLNSIQ